MYSEQVLDHFHHPRNVGEIERATAVIETSNPVCGDTMKLWLAVREGIIRDVKFKVQGCIPAIACASWLTEAVKGKSLQEAGSITPQEIEAGLGGLPLASRHASALVIAALRKALEGVNAHNVRD
ncbi:MAG TPA: iron-sulfur cluster assembly scaffold protein [Terriglobia bacterium]|jgi:nitrogen fixation NifU-like protein|nr:iron-sulfur cluster assembly scaffold protein [Terriglobia bacterium]